MRTAIFLLLVTFLYGEAVANEPKPDAVKAWDRYIALTESRIDAELRDPNSFLDLSRESQAKVKRGEAVVQKLATKDDGKSIEAPGALIHDWVGTAFIPNSTIQQAFAVLQDYDHHSITYAPEVQKSKLISRSGDDFNAYLRFVKKKVITVVLDTYHRAHYGTLDAAHAYSRSYTTKIAEIEGPGRDNEREKSVEEQDGFMWKMNTYWRFEERDGGLYIQCEAVTLTRDVPFGLAWIIEPFVNSIPKESLISTMNETRRALAK